MINKKDKKEFPLKRKAGDWVEIITTKKLIQLDHMFNEGRWNEDPNLWCSTENYAVFYRPEHIRSLRKNNS